MVGGTKLPGVRPDQWELEQAWVGVVREAERSFGHGADALEPIHALGALGITGSSDVTPFDVYSAEYIAAYRGSRRTYLAPKQSRRQAIGSMSDHALTRTLGRMGLCLRGSPVP